MTLVTWLHISDWHQSGKDFDRKVVRDAFITDLTNRKKIDGSLQQVDFVVFSGDAAYRAAPEEYEEARTQLFLPVLKALSLSNEKLFLVPGNHDLDRSTVEELLPSALQVGLKSEREIQYWLDDERRRRKVLEPFEAFSEFAVNMTAQHDAAFASIKNIRTATGATVGMLGLNSAWLSGRVKTPEGSVNDYGHLAVGEPQIHDGIRKIAEADVRIAVLHHSPEWLFEFDRHRVTRLDNNVDFILTGHQHKPSVTVQQSTDGRCIRIPAGAIYDRREANKPIYTNGYNFVSLDLERGNGTVFLRRWSDPRTEWIEDNDTHPGGKYSFTLDKRDRADYAQAAESASCTLVESNVRDAEAKYQKLLLDSCDLINLANLPEADRHIAHRQLELRRLYVPLRVIVDEAEDLPDGVSHSVDGDGDGEEFETLDDDRVSFGSVLQDNKRVVVLGDPGSGKTTLTHWLITAYLLRLKQDPEWQQLPDASSLPQNDHMPILVRCRDLDEQSLRGNLSDILEHCLRKAELKEYERIAVLRLMQDRIDNDKALLIFDGLDEIDDPTLRSGLCKQIENVLLAHKELPIIATSRIVGYRDMGYKLSRGFKHVRLTDLLPAEKDDFARRWCALTEIPSRVALAIKELIEDIHSGDRIERLTGNPMLLTTMALVKRRVGKLPKRKAELYADAVQVLLNWRREIDAPLDWNEAVPQLEYLAYAMCERGVQQLRRDEIVDLFSRMREEYPNVHLAQARPPEKFLSLLEARTGIIMQTGHVRHMGVMAPIYEFKHLTIQEYLAARALVDGRFPGRKPKTSVADSVVPLSKRLITSDHSVGGSTVSWHEVLTLCPPMCLDEDVDAVLLAILESDKGETLEEAVRRMSIAGLCLAAEINVSVSVGTRIISAMFSAMGDEDVDRGIFRNVVVELQGTRWGAQLNDKLFEGYIADHPTTKRGPKRFGSYISVATSAFAPRDPSELADWIDNRVLWLKSESQRQVVEAALGFMHLSFVQRSVYRDGVVEALIKHLGNSAPEAHAAAWALGWMNAKRPSAKGDAALQWSPSEGELVQLLEFVKKQESDPQAVRFLSWILGSYKVRAAVAPLASRLSSPHDIVVSQITRQMGNIGDAEAVPHLLAVLSHDNAEVRSSALDSILKIGTLQNPRQLEVCLKDNDPQVRASAVRVLGYFLKDEAFLAIGAIASDESPKVRRAIAAQLQTMSDPDAIAKLKEYGRDSDSGVREMAIRAIIKDVEDIDIAIMTRDFDGYPPALDLSQPISLKRVAEAAAHLEVSAEDIRRRYGRLAEVFAYALEW